ncbi:DNA-binding CsgD family transcriptional regulator [Arthrobacter sp. GAS37]|uniref:helix-turn-helix transcriptional regulator n=1 Tax=Arthrobacter sp. GAS37 TaxID=3156261 RepID=UPI0038344E18
MFESAAVVDIVQRRTQRPLVVTMDGAPLGSGASVFTPARWPEATIRLGPLDYDQVNKLLAQTLGSPPEVDLTTAVLMKSGGGAVRDRDHQLLKILLDQYEADSDLPAITRLLKSTLRRFLHKRHRGLAKTLHQIISAFENRFPPQGVQLTLDTGNHPQGLTAREREIAILAGSQRTPEIAALLGISPRTVENHISRARGKTGTTTRQSLYEHARNSQTIDG